MTFDIDTLRVSESHKTLSGYIKREAGKAVKPEIIALVEVMRETYRKDPEVVAERERAAAARQAEKQAAFQKRLERMQREAARLGLTLQVGGADESGQEPDAEEVVEDTEPEPAPATPRARRQRRPTPTVLPDPEPEVTTLATVTPLRSEPVNPLTATPADDVSMSSDIEVITEEDGWANIPEADEPTEDW
jgi:hypothetical protein